MDCATDQELLVRARSDGAAPGRRGVRIGFRALR
jgi:hypothetical protein